MENLRNARMPQGAPVGRLLQVLAVGGLGVYGLSNSLFNVEGGHRAIVFNRLSGIKDRVSGNTTGMLGMISSGVTTE